MADLSKYILQALYEATGQSGTPVDVVGTLHRRWPQISVQDVRTHAGALSVRGHIMLRSDGAATITGAGIRGLSELWASGAFGQIPPAAKPYVERLHAAARAHAEVDDESGSTRPYSSVHVQAIVAEQARRNEVIVDDEITQEEEPASAPRASTNPAPTTISAPPPAPGGTMPQGGPLATHLDQVRQAVHVLTQEVSASTSLSMDDWSKAIELTAQLEGILDGIGALLPPGP